MYVQVTLWLTEYSSQTQTQASKWAVNCAHWIKAISPVSLIGCLRSKETAIDHYYHWELLWGCSPHSLQWQCLPAHTSTLGTTSNWQLNPHTRPPPPRPNYLTSTLDSCGNELVFTLLWFLVTMHNCRLLNKMLDALLVWLKQPSLICMLISILSLGHFLCVHDIDHVVVAVLPV